MDDMVKLETRNGRRSYFDGGLLHYLALRVLAIYGFWFFIKLEDWKAKHTSFVN